MTGSGSRVKATIFRYFQPAALVAIVVLWSVMPAAWLDPWVFVAIALTTRLTILGLERVNERHASWRMDRRELVTDVFYMLLVIFAISKVRKLVVDQPLISARHALGLETPWAMHWPMLVQVVVIIALIEFGQYWMHRLMHDNHAFWLTHAPHHHVPQLNALKGSVGNPLELFLVGLSVAVLFDFDLSALLCVGHILTAVTCFAHANVRFNPPRWYAFVFTTIEHHSLHHSVTYEDTRCNYGNALIVFDRMFGTFRDGEAEAVGQDDRRRLTIREQFLFPFVPLIALVKARRADARAA